MDGRRVIVVAAACALGLSSLGMSCADDAVKAGDSAVGGLDDAGRLGDDIPTLPVSDPGVQAAENYVQKYGVTTTCAGLSLAQGDDLGQVTADAILSQLPTPPTEQARAAAENTANLVNSLSRGDVDQAIDELC